MNPCSILCLRALLGALAVLPLAGRGAPAAKPSPYEQQIGTAVHKLADARPAIRRQAAESLGILRAYSAADTLIAKLEDPAEEVRRSAAIALGWCGGRRIPGTSSSTAPATRSRSVHARPSCRIRCTCAFQPVAWRPFLCCVRPCIISVVPLIPAVQVRLHRAST